MTAETPAQRDPVHLMTIEMGAWCGATGPGNGRASSAWREVTCTDCHARRTAWFLALVWDMLQAMPASHAALAFAVRAGRLGVTDERGRPLAMACAADVDAAPEPQPAPELAAAELSQIDITRAAAANTIRKLRAELAAHREALEQIAKHHADDDARVRVLAKIAKRTLDGK